MVNSVKLADLCEQIADCPHSTPMWTDSGVVVLRSPNIRGGRLDLSNASYTDEEHFRLRTRRATPQAGDIVITREAPMGEVCAIPEGLRCCLGQRMVLLRPDTSRIDSRYLLYALQAPQVRHEILVHEGTGSTVSNLRIPMLEALPIPVGDLAYQQEIGCILGSLDDKIELNRRMNGLLEGMARAIFKAWFIEFEPRSSSDGISTVQQWIDRGALLIGDGYRAKRSELGESGLPFIRAGNLQNHGITFENAEILSQSSVEAAGVKISQPQDVAFTSKGTVGRMTLVSDRTPKFVYSPQLCWWRVTDSENLNAHVLYRWMESREFMNQVASVKGQTDMAEYVSLRDQRRMQLTLPPIEDQHRISGVLASLDELIAANVAESRILASIRDTLLPKLISGQLRLAQED